MSLVETVGELVVASEERDVPTLQRLLARATWRVPGKSLVSGTFVGAEAILGHFGKLRGLSDGTYKVTVTDVLESEDRVAVLARAKGARGGRVFDKRHVLLVEFADGSIRDVALLNEDPAAFDAFWS